MIKSLSNVLSLIMYKIEKFEYRRLELDEEISKHDPDDIKIIKALYQDINNEKRFEILCNAYRCGNIEIKGPDSYNTNLYYLNEIEEESNTWPGCDYGSASRTILLRGTPEDYPNKLPIGHNVIVYTNGMIEKFFNFYAIEKITLDEIEYWALGRYVHSLDQEVDFPLSESDELFFNLRYR